MISKFFFKVFPQCQFYGILLNTPHIPWNKEEQLIKQKKSICSWLTKEIKHTNKNKKLKGQDLQCKKHEILFHKPRNKQIQTNKNYHHKIIRKLKEKAAIKRLLIIMTMEIYSEGITMPQNV